MQRADKLLVEQNLVESRSKAQQLIESGAVKALVNGQLICVEKPSLKLDETTGFKIESDKVLRYVSRAGLKLEYALKKISDRELISSHFAEFSREKTAFDVGQSTGGFTHCLLEHGFKTVVGVDVGHGQLHHSLKSDSRVFSYEGINAKTMEPGLFLSHVQSGFDCIVMDVSFISQTKIIPKLRSFTHKDTIVISLVKPQFELGKDSLNKRGIVNSKDSYKKVQSKIESTYVEFGFKPLAYFESSILGQEGNREYFIVAKLND